MSKGTTHRTVRVDDGLWDKAKEVASDNGENLSDIIRSAIMEYVKSGLTEDQLREVELKFSSQLWDRQNAPHKITIRSLVDLEALCAQHDTSLVISCGEGGKLTEIEIYDDYRE